MTNTTNGSFEEDAEMLKVPQTEAEYRAALETIDRLLELDPEPETDDARRLEALAVLAQEYERRTAPLGDPTPVEAIQFRMEQQGLSQRDLVPYIGSKSKVSEVLSGKRPLSLPMIRALHKGLGIPAEVLLGGRDQSELEPVDLNWSAFPLREMLKRGWLSVGAKLGADEPEDLLRAFFKPLGGPRAVVAMYRTTSHVRSGREMDRHALIAWTARVLFKALQRTDLGPYKEGSITVGLMNELVSLSWSEMGPRLAKELLAKRGIPLVIEPHLPRTYLDGAAMFSEELRAPVIALTIRHDRVDNFWFTLMHELVHAGRHLGSRGTAQFYDDLDVEELQDDREREADTVAGEALIPEATWQASPASRLRTPEAVRYLAEQLHIHPAIVAGRLRYQFKSYRRLSQLVGHGDVRKCFPEISWE